MKNIAVFISGSGSNAEQIMKHFQNSPLAKVALMLSNRADAYGIERAKKFNVPTIVFNRPDFYDKTDILTVLKSHNIDYIVLAGFMWLVPTYIINAYRDRIVNIHPALLPKYGGKGMYGDNVHRAVIAAGESESGITIHKVNEVYDSGDIILQAKTVIEKGDTPEMLADKIHKLEHENFSKAIESEIIKLK